MIDPRNMPCARVCLPRLSAKELPPNAQEQYHNYTIKRKSSMTSLNAGKDTNEVGMPSPRPVDFSFVSGGGDQVQTSASSLNAARETTWADISHQYLPGNNTDNTTETSVQSAPPNYSYVPLARDCLGIEPVNVTANTLSTKRRNSVVSTSSRCSSGSSKGSELIASVCLTPVTWKTPRYTTRPYEHCVPETELECSEVLSDVTDDSTLSGAESIKSGLNFMTKILVSNVISHTVKFWL